MNPCRKLIGAAVLLLAGNLLATTPKPKPIDFNRDVRPILSDNCLYCHGPDEKHRKAKLRLDMRDNATAVRGDIQPVKPKDLAGSDLWKRINSKDPDEMMPPPDSNKKLTAEQIQTLRRWIEEGAEYKGHWAFEAPKKPEPPLIKNKKWAKNEIDYFIAARLAEKSLKPEDEASKEKLIRRVTFDLTGLPPSLFEIKEFLNDKKPGAYERLVDRLLASPRYGEHQARYWLDAVRYGDTHGLHLDNERSMWPYRDWVVKAFNENLPYDKFTLWQIAGDELPNATQEQKVASGYNRCNVSTSEGGAIEEEFYVRYAIDRTETTSIVWMGLTAGCAVCHDHKFDPISQKEFYSLYWFFNNSREKAMDGNALLPPPSIKIADTKDKATLAAIDAEIAPVKKELDDALTNIKYKDPSPKKLGMTEEAQEFTWVEDQFPKGTTAQKAGEADLQWVTATNGFVFSGEKAIKRTATGLAQDFFEGSKQPMIAGKSNILFAYVYLDPTNPPKAIMLQFHTTDWNYRANWGDEDAIPFGAKGTEAKFLMGKLPPVGKWVRLEVNTDDLKFRYPTRINGMAFVQFGGTVYWDKAGVVTRYEQVDNSPKSFFAWQTFSRAENGVGLPEELARLVKAKAGQADTNELASLKKYYLQNVYEGSPAIFGPLHAKLEPLQKKRTEYENNIPSTLVMEEMDKPRGAFVLKRGEYDRRGDEVQPGVPRFLPPLPKTDKTNRVALATWLVSTNHPLTARVVVNRYWQQFFGTGIVKTAQDFGSQGEWPSHPELLDWLATTFMETGWDVKRMHKLMVMSAAYRQDNKVTKENLQGDPENRFVSRGPRFRLDAEEIRDNALYVSGLLDEKMGGHSVKPYQPSGVWEAVGYTASNTAKFVQDHGDALYRRSLYTFWKRTAPPPSLVTFDAPSREKYCVRRERTDTPLQALVVMNDPQYVEAARHLGERMIKISPNENERLDFAFELLTSRHPSRGERTVLKDLLESSLSKYSKNAEAAQKLISVGESPVNKEIKPAELAAYTMVASTLLNMDEVLNKN